MPKARRFVLAAGVLALYVLHQDFWLWRSARPLLFGFLPVGLAYHALYTIAVAAMMALLVHLAWPDHLEADPPDVPR